MRNPTLFTFLAIKHYISFMENKNLLRTYLANKLYFVRLKESVDSYRLDHQPLFGKGARVPPPKGRRPETRERRKSSLRFLRLGF